MQRLHAAGRDHIWAYYTRNLVRPVVLSREKVDVIIGNPPWLNYNAMTVSIAAHGIGGTRARIATASGPAGSYATAPGHVAGLFFTRCCTDLYLRERRRDRHGVAPQRPANWTIHQVAQWRLWYSKPQGQGRSRSVETLPCRLEVRLWSQGWLGTWNDLEPNTFFPVPAGCLFQSA